MLGWRAVSIRVDPVSFASGNYTRGRRLYFVVDRNVPAPSWPGLSRPSTSLLSAAPKTWMPGTSSAKTRFALLPGHDERESELVSAYGADLEHVAVVARFKGDAKLPTGGGF